MVTAVVMTLLPCWRKNEDSNQDNSQAKKFPVAIPYLKGLSEELQRVFKSHGVPTYHKPFNTLRSLLVRPKDKSKKEKQCGLLYSVKFKECNKEYVGETARSLGTRFKEHTDGKHPNSAITEHTQDTGHRYSIEDVKVLNREDKLLPRKVREAINIHKRKPALNRDRGHEIPPILLQLLPLDFHGQVAKPTRSLQQQ